MSDLRERCKNVLYGLSYFPPEKNDYGDFIGPSEQDINYLVRFVEEERKLAADKARRACRRKAQK